MSARNAPGIFQTLVVTMRNNITTIRMNRPHKRNAYSLKMYSEIIRALELAGKDDSAIAVITGTGDYYCSGNDLTNVTESMENGIEETRRYLFRDFVRAFIDFPKPLIAVVNGPSVGAAVTTLGLVDMVYATEKASEMLLFGKTLSAMEAYQQGLVTKVFTDSTFQVEVWKRLTAYAQLPKNSLALSKQLMRRAEKEKLHAINDRESELVNERLLSEEFLKAVTDFFRAKSKL